MLKQLSQIGLFSIKNDETKYKVKKNETGDYMIFKAQPEIFIGYVTEQGYYCKVTRLVGGMTLSKEIAYSEIIISHAKQEL